MFTSLKLVSSPGWALKSMLNAHLRVMKFVIRNSADAIYLCRSWCHSPLIKIIWLSQMSYLYYKLLSGITLNVHLRVTVYCTHQEL